MVRNRIFALTAFAGVILAAGSVLALGVGFTADTMTKAVATVTPPKTRALPSYLVRMPELKPADLDIAKSVPVRPVVKVPNVRVQQAALETTPASGTVEKLPPREQVRQVVEVSPYGENPVAGTPYVVNVNVDAVSVRAGPSKDAGRIDTIAGGTAVTVTADEGGWLNVHYAGGSGWVYRRYLDPTGGSLVADAGSAN